jgi:hypothetical protein
MAILVQMRGEMLDDIESNVLSTKGYVVKTKKKLTKAKEK